MKNQINDALKRKQLGLLPRDEIEQNKQRGQALTGRLFIVYVASLIAVIIAYIIF